MNGMTEKEVIKSRKENGSNIITKVAKESFIKLLISTLSDPIIKILLIALAIKTLFLFKNFDWYETIGILIAIFLASLISTISEYGSEKAFEKLEEDASKIKCIVVRNKKKKEIPIEEIVVNDLLIIEAGNQIPIDGIILKGNVIVNESNLNGETKEKIRKTNEKIYKSTVVNQGRALVKTTEVGDKTVYGKLAKEVSERTQDSPIKLRLTKLAKQISKIGYLGAILVSVSYLFSVIVIDNNFNIELIQKTITNIPLLFGHILHALTLSVTILVVSVPEGLPMMITLVLSSNMKRMIKSKVLVRKMTGIETAGNINILFTDKTGTITKGNLSVIAITDMRGKTYRTEEELKIDKAYYEIVKTSLINNTESEYSNEEIIGGNITDRAILKFFKPTEKSKIINREPFNSKNKYSKTKIYCGKNIELIKGAPEIIIDKCKYYYEKGKKYRLLNKERIYKQIKEATKKGIRVIAFAYKEDKEYIFLGLIHIKDEVRKEAVEGLKKINKAGIKIILLTGDNIETAKSIGKEVGILENGIVIDSKDLNNMTDDEIKEKLSKIKIIARTLPQDKSRLIKIAQSMNLVVGMTGDGVNDAPALKKADVGFSMGSGTEVAKEASDIVIIDDNLLSISNAILYGRTIFKSIRKFIIFQLTMNICAVSISIIGPFIGIETPVTVVQMLWINMIMDTLAALAFSFEPALKEYMNEKPKDKKEQIINSYMKGEIIFTGLFTSLMCILFLKLPIIKNIYRNEKIHMTAFFGLFIFMGIFNSFNSRTNRLNILADLSKNKIFISVVIFIIIVQTYLIYYGGNIFRTYGLNLKELYLMIAISSTVIPADIIRKIYLKKQGKTSGV